jgi:AraC-like DNA-binding protein
VHESKPSASSLSRFDRNEPASIPKAASIANRATAHADGWSDAARAAFEVGYESASQFNLEYSRLFGQPPMRDIKAKALRTANIVATSVT